jgi:hypothetical protein
MQYKTIVISLLEQRPEMYEQLRIDRLLLPTLNAYADHLKAKHEAWMGELRRVWPQSDPSQIASEALELALEDLQAHLPRESSTDDNGPLSLDDAMAYLRKRTPHA